MNISEPLISVILPIYNMERYLERCLDSVLNNTYRNLEVICIDDGSKDNSLEILRSYEAADPRIVVIAKENGGVSSARNAGLDRMTGEYVTFVDPDDFVHPQYVELLFRALQDTETNIAICTFQKVEAGSDFQPEEILYSSDALQILSFAAISREHELRGYSGGRMIRSKLTEGIRFRKDLQYGEDTIFFAEICEVDKANKAAVLYLPLYYYYQREDSLNRSAGSTEQLTYIQAVVQKLLQQDGRDDLYLDQSIRVSLTSRFRFTYFEPDPKAVHEYSKLLISLLGRVRKTDFYSLKEKMGIHLFILFPLFYRVYRILKDPSVLAWEKMEREKRRQCAANAVNDNSV